MCKAYYFPHMKSTDDVKIDFSLSNRALKKTSNALTFSYLEYLNILE